MQKDPAMPWTPCRSRRSPLALALLTSLAVACGEPMDDDEGTDSDALEPADPEDALDLLAPPELGPTEPLIAEVHYQTRWNQYPAGAWTTVTDLGYRVTVERGGLVNYSAALVECLDARGHGSSINPTQTTRAVFESLTSPAPGLLDARTFTASRFCHAHYLVARSDDDTLGLPEEPALAGLSLWVAGRYQAPGAEEGDEVPFEIAATSPFGALFELPTGDMAEGSDEPMRATIVIERELDTLLDGVDFEHDDDDARARQVVENAVAHTTVTLTLTPLDPDAPLPTSTS